MGTSFYNISSWGIYLFTVPLGFCLILLLAKQGSVEQKKAGILSVTAGVIIAVLLGRLSFVEGHALMKVVMTLLGTALCFGAIEYNNRRRLSKNKT